MSLIPNDLYRCGKQTFAVERKASFLDAAGWSAIIASSSGLAETLSDDGYAFAGASAESPDCGFTTVPFVMRSEGGGDVVIASELQLDGLNHPQTANDRVVFSDGTNTLAISAEAPTDAFGNTLYTAVIGGVTTSGVLAHKFNISAAYAASRRGSGALNVRVNYRYRVDKTRGELSLWVNDQLKGAAAIPGLESFGTCAWQYLHAGYYHYSHGVFLRQIGLRLES